ncbi:MAG: hypothetical protein CVU44_06140 [Chloroflexi bacterium HGW-Chloroflexi-6]|nr:MAG: hypothetical protein CVU44_06140 [Chloroflexi bacterium HGW-Chloroflexi-6]
MVVSEQKEQIGILFSEIEQASRWGRPSILVVVCSSAKLRKEMQDLLSSSIEPLGLQAVEYAVSAATYDIPLTLSRHPERKRSVFYVTRLNRGGGNDNRNAFRALNMRRELLVDYPTRVVFWLTKAEAKALALLAPDFWAFRHVSLEA